MASEDSTGMAEEVLELYGGGRGEVSPTVLSSIMLCFYRAKKWNFWSVSGKF